MADGPLTLVRTGSPVGRRLEQALAPQTVIRVGDGLASARDRLTGLPEPADDDGPERLLLELFGDEPLTGSSGIPDDDVWDRAHEVLDLAMAAIRRVGPRMIRRGAGRVLFVLPAAIKEPRELPLVATAFGAGLQGLAKHCANEWGHGTGVNTVLWRTSPQAAQHDGELDSVARTAAFLLSDAADHLNGAAVMVDGGVSKSIF